MTDPKMTDTHILGDNAPRKSNFDPDLARKLTKYYEEHPEELNDRPKEKSKVPPAITLPAGNTSGSLEQIEGNYLEAIKSAVPETIQTSAELQKARGENSQKYDSHGDEFELAFSLSLTHFTANVPLYGVEKGKPFLLFGRREAFLRLYVPRIEAVHNQILGPNGVYTLPDADKAWALEEGISSGALNRFDLAELIELELNKRWGYFTLKTKGPAQLKGAKRELAELIHGQGDDYFKCMKMLKDKVISQTEIHLLNPDYVNFIAGKKLVGQTSLLFQLSDQSNFEACSCDATLSYRLRGVRKK